MTTAGQAKRRYDARSRQSQAQETRDRILTVARRLFVENGFAATSMARIATEAGVSTPTVFAGFKSKVNLLKEAVDTAIAGDTEERPLRERPVLQRVHEGRTFDEVVDRMADAFAEVAPRSYGIYAVVHAAADGDPQIAELLRELDRQRLVGAGLLAEKLASSRASAASPTRPGGQAPSHPGTTFSGESVEEIRDRLWVLMSPLQYGMIVRDLGHTDAWYREWVARQLRSIG